MSLIFIVAIMLCEGLGLYKGREVSFFLILSFPLIFFLKDLLERRKIEIPTTLSILWMFFLFFSLISTFFAVNVDRSVEYHYYYISIYLIFVYFYNHRDLEDKICTLLVGLGIFFCIYSSLIYLSQWWLKYSYIPLPLDGYQLVYSKFGSHNHLGDFLVIPLIITLYRYLKTKKKKWGLLGALFGVYIVISFSRSAYLSLIVGLVFLIRLKSFKLTGKLISVVFSIIIVFTVLIFGVVKESKPIPVLGQVQKIAQEYFGLKDKEITAKRFEFMSQSIEAVLSKPLFGYGPGNFREASVIFNSYGTVTHTAHNIFLDIAVEQGIFGFIFFLLLSTRLLKDQLKNKTLLSIIILAFIMNALTDYTYRIYSFFFLLIIMIGLAYREKGVTLNSPKKIVLLAFALVVLMYPLLFKGDLT